MGEAAIPAAALALEKGWECSKCQAYRAAVHSEETRSDYKAEPFLTLPFLIEEVGWIPQLTVYP